MHFLPTTTSSLVCYLRMHSAHKSIQAQCNYFNINTWFINLIFRCDRWCIVDLETCIFFVRTHIQLIYWSVCVFLRVNCIYETIATTKKNVARRHRERRRREKKNKRVVKCAYNVCKFSLKILRLDVNVVRTRV